MDTSKCYQQRNLLLKLTLPNCCLLIFSVIVTKPNSDPDCPTQSTAHQLTLHCDEGNYSVHCRIPNKEKGQLMLKRSELLTGFQARIFFFFFWSYCTWHVGIPWPGMKPHTFCSAKSLTTEHPGKPRQRFVKAALRLRVVGYLLSWWTFFCLLGGKVIRWCLGGKVIRWCSSPFMLLTSLGSKCLWSACSQHLSPGLAGCRGVLSFCKTTQRYASSCYIYPMRKN